MCFSQRLMRIIFKHVQSNFLKNTLRLSITEYPFLTAYCPSALTIKWLITVATIVVMILLLFVVVVLVFALVEFSFLWSFESNFWPIHLTGTRALTTLNPRTKWFQGRRIMKAYVIQLTQLAFTCSKLTIEWSLLTIVFIVNFEHISQCSSVSNINFEHVITGWVIWCDPLKGVSQGLVNKLCSNLMWY